MRKPAFAAAFVIVFLLFSLCVGFNLTAAPTETKDVLKIGVTSGPHAEIMQIVKNAAEKDGLQLVIIEFNDYIQPNIALNRGDIDANSFQNALYLDNMVKDRKYAIIPAAKTVLFPMGIYSKKTAALAGIADKSTVVIPNDPENSSRALLLLAKAGCVTLKSSNILSATIADIADNPKELIFKEADAAHISRSLNEADLVVINSNYAVMAGLTPLKDALLLETVDSPYTSVIAVRPGDGERRAMQKFIAAYHSEEVKQYILSHFKGSMLTAW